MILAHQGGWDEFLDFAVPVSAGMLVLRLLYRFERKPFETPIEVRIVYIAN